MEDELNIDAGKDFLAMFLNWELSWWIIKQLMNSAFVGYEEFSRSRRVLSTEAEASEDNTLRDLLNSSYPTKAEFINC